MQINKKRIRKLNSFHPRPGKVVYWMSRDQRSKDNWALLAAQKIASEYKSELVVLFNLLPEFADATIRQYYFMLEGLKETEKALRSLNIPLVLTTGLAEENIPMFLKKSDATVLVSDFSPLLYQKHWNSQISKVIKIVHYQVDAHNIVPVWHASQKEEYGARTLRPKIHKLLGEFLTDIPAPEIHRFNLNIDKFYPKIDFDSLAKTLRVDTTVQPVYWLKSGTHAAIETASVFLESKVSGYHERRNNPNLDAQSNLSPYLHFGQIAAQRVAYEAMQLKHVRPDLTQDLDTFLEELIVRRELSDNFCFYNENYLGIESFRPWARATLAKHIGDPREYIYSQDEFEKAKTHDPLWNAAQLEMVKTGKMHGFLRMYWAKKILEWCELPQEAMNIAIYLNDKYQLDGRDPNGYTGIAWSIGGVHDRAWFERPVLGQIRYMNFNGCKRKFDVDTYIQKIDKM